MSLERVHLDVLRYLYDNLPEDESVQGDISRKILFKSVNFKPKQVEKACNELGELEYVRLKSGFYTNDWASISITDKGMDYLESVDG